MSESDTDAASESDTVSDTDAVSESQSGIQPERAGRGGRSFGSPRRPPPLLLVTESARRQLRRGGRGVLPGDRLLLHAAHRVTSLASRLRLLGRLDQDARALLARAKPTRSLASELAAVDLACWAASSSSASTKAWSTFAMSAAVVVAFPSLSEPVMCLPTPETSDWNRCL